jgi:hypothetical protein
MSNFFALPGSYTLTGKNALSTAEDDDPIPNELIFYF